MKKAKKTRRKKQIQQSTSLKEEEKEIRMLLELVHALEEEAEFVDLEICPKCKSPKVRRVGSMSGDLWGHMAILPSKSECEECGWRGRLGLQATNRSLGIKDVAMMMEAADLDEAQIGKMKHSRESTSY
jgi:hypothetical protein